MATPGYGEPSGGRSGLLVGLLAASLILTTIYFREGERGPLRMARNAVHAVASPFIAAGGVVTRPFRSVARATSGFGASATEVAQLRSQNAELRRRVAELEEARLENARLRSLVSFVKATNMKSLGAHVIGRPSSAWEGVITVDRGTSDGIKVGQPVIGAGGLLGQTIGVTARSATVRLITDQRSGVAAIVQATRAPGVVRGSIDGAITLDFVSRETTVKPGDIVVTSGIGGVYPKGLLVAEVVSSEGEANGLYADIRLRPAASFEGIEEVLILTGAPPALEGGSGE